MTFALEEQVDIVTYVILNFTQQLLCKLLVFRKYHESETRHTYECMQNWFYFSISTNAAAKSGTDSDCIGDYIEVRLFYNTEKLSLCTLHSEHQVEIGL